MRLSGAESLGVNLNPVGSRVHLGEEEAPVRIALDGADRAGIHLGCLDLGIGNHRAALVRDAPARALLVPLCAQSGRAITVASIKVTATIVLPVALDII